MINIVHPALIDHNPNGNLIMFHVISCFILGSIVMILYYCFYGVFYGYMWEYGILYTYVVIYVIIHTYVVICDNKHISHITQHNIT